MTTNTKKYRYAVVAQYRGDHVFLSMLSSFFRKNDLGYQQSFRKTTNGRYCLKLWFFEKEGYKKLQRFCKLINDDGSPSIEHSAKINVNYFTYAVMRKNANVV